MRRFSACVFCALPSGHALPYFPAHCRLYGHGYTLAIFTYITRRSRAAALPCSLPHAWTWLYASHIHVHNSAVICRRIPLLTAACIDMATLVIFTYITQRSRAAALLRSLPHIWAWLYASHMRVHDLAVTRRRTPPAHCLHLWIMLCADKHMQTHIMPLMRTCIMYHTAHLLQHTCSLRTHIVSPRVPASGCTRSTRPVAGSLGAVRALSARSPAALAPYLCAMRAIVSPGCATQ